MNEQIEELARQAADGMLSYDEEGKWQLSEREVQKFAELIVRECANHCDLLLDHKISSEWSRGTHDCSRAIKKHFGVEE
jgi:hypothetical protein